MSRDPFADVYTEQNQVVESSEFRSLPGDLEIETPDFLGDIPSADWTPQERNRSWERQHPTASYRGVDPALNTAIGQIAADLGLKRRDDVARAFLEYGLHLYQSGELRLIPVLDAGRLTLYPAKGSGQSRNPWRRGAATSQVRKPPRRDKAKDKEPRWKQRAHYRIPKSLQRSIGQIAYGKNDYDSRLDRPVVPIGEVVTVFLRRAIDDYRQGILVLKPQPVGDMTLFPNQQP